MLLMNRTTPILIVVALLVLAAAGYLLFGKSETSAVTSLEGTPATQAEQTFLALASRIDPVDFDSNVLDDPRFKALRDMRVAILPEQSGRIDPFAPLGR